MALLGLLGQVWVTAEASLAREWQMIGVWRDADAAELHDPGIGP